MYRLDQPISDQREDRLKRHRFVEGVARRLVHEGSATGITIGLVGPWGSGKSSILNLLAKHLDDIGAIVVRFDSGRDQATDRAIKVIEKYGETISPIFRLIFPGMDVVAKAFSTLVRESEKRGASIFAQREKVRKAIGDIKTPIVVLIDEMDRIEDAEVRTLAQLIRAVADFSGISYLAAYDEARVVEALGGGDTSSQTSRGRGYLEKIIQIRLSVPYTDPNESRRLLRDEIDLTFSANGWKLDDYQNERLLQILDIIVPDAISTGRDVRRLIADIEGRLLLSDHRVDPVDCVGYSALQLKAPSVSEAIMRSLSKPLENICFEEYFHEYIASREGVLALPYVIHEIIMPSNPSWSDKLFSQLWPPTLERKGPYFGVSPARIMFKRPLLTLAQHVPPETETERDAIIAQLVEGLLTVELPRSPSGLVNVLNLVEESVGRISSAQALHLIESAGDIIEGNVDSDSRFDTMSILLIAGAIHRIIDRMTGRQRPDLAHVIAKRLLENSFMVLACALLLDRGGFQFVNSSSFGWSASPMSEKKLGELRVLYWKTLQRSDRSSPQSWPICLPYLVFREREYADRADLANLRAPRLINDIVKTFFSGPKSGSIVQLAGILDHSALLEGFRENRSISLSSTGRPLPGFSAAYEYLRLDAKGRPVSPSSRRIRLSGPREG
jgi:hypothetical protein